MRRISFFIVCFFFLLALPIPRSKAQDTVSTPPPNIEDLRTQYRKSLDDYRNKEDQFSIASQQYYTLKTLASQEDAVHATRDVELARVNTILIYIQNLRATLDAHSGVELSRKMALGKQFDLLVTTLKEHRSRVEIAINRIQVEQENVFMEKQQDTVTALSYEALSLIKIGAIQAALDQLVVTQQSVNDYIAKAPISETTRLEKQRGSDEVTRSIDTIKQTVARAMNTYDVGLTHVDNSFFRKIQEILGPAYGNLTQSLEFVKELSQ